MELFSSALPQLQGFTLQIVRLILWLVVLSVIFAPLERLFALHDEKIFRKEILIDLFYYFLNSLLPGLILAAPLALVAAVTRRYLPVGLTTFVAGLPFLVRLAASLVVGEFGFYWGHRWTHEIPLLWRFHAIHHSAEHMDFLVSSRAHPVDMVFVRLCGMVPLYMVGLATPGNTAGSGLVPVLVILITTIWGFFIHANIKWRFGPLEYLVATPAFHHWHHTNDGAEVINKNYASLLPFLDKCFGTLFLPAATPARYGITEAMPSSLHGQLLGAFLPHRRAAQTAQDEQVVTE